MEHVDEIAQMMAAEGGGGITAHSVVIDITDNHGWVGFLGFMSMDFWYQGSKIAMVFADGDFTSGQTSFFSASFIGQFAFDTTLGKTGGSTGQVWLAANGTDSNQRIWIRFASPIIFDEIRYNNYHQSGGQTTIGANNAVIKSTEDTGVPSNAFNAAVTGGVTIWTGAFDEHIAANIEDEKIITL